jgi:sigma-E factor negative regulatory protein RseA
MTDQIREQVSAMLDGELPQGEIGLLVRRMERNPELRRAFASYSLIGEMLRAPGGPTAQPLFAARVAQAIEGSAGNAVPVAAAVSAASAPASAVWRRPAFASAIAAGFVLAAFVLARPYLQQETAMVASTAAVATGVRPLAGASSPTPAQSQRLAGYLVAHSQFSSPLGRHNVWSGLLADDPGITRVAFDMSDAP